MNGFPVLTIPLVLAMMASMIYPGGKERAAARIINLMPPHDVFIEPFLGGGAVLRAKRPAQLSIGVDLDPQVIERWKSPEMGSAYAETGGEDRHGEDLGRRPALPGVHAGNGVGRPHGPSEVAGLGIVAGRDPHAGNGVSSGDTRAHPPADAENGVARSSRRALRALDLFCGAGGATKGLQMAGFHVTGIDEAPQPRYCGDIFIQSNALEADLSGYDFIWASPPCQAFSVATAAVRNLGKVYPDLVSAVRSRLVSSGLPYVIENVKQAPLIDPMYLDGTMFPGLKVIRKRAFESNVTMTAPASAYRPGLVAYEGWSCVVGGGRLMGTPKEANAWHTNEAKRAAMGIDWMRRKELAQAIPPPYSEYIGRQVRSAIEDAHRLRIPTPDVAGLDVMSWRGSSADDSIHAETGGESGQEPGATGPAGPTGDTGPCYPITPEMALVDQSGRRTEFWSGDGIEFLKRYPFTGSEVVYCDPPYPMETRSSGRLYHCEMTDAQHRELLRVITGLPCKVLISGYDCTMYREALAGWRSERYRTMTRGGETTELLWFNFARPADGNASGARLHDYAKLGNGYRERERIRRKTARWKGRLERLPQHERVILTAFAQADTRGRERLQRKIDRWRGALNRLNLLERRALLSAIGDPASSGGVVRNASSSGGGLDVLT